MLPEFIGTWYTRKPIADSSRVVLELLASIEVLQLKIMKTKFLIGIIPQGIISFVSKLRRMNF